MVMKNMSGVTLYLNKIPMYNKIEKKLRRAFEFLSNINEKAS
jgi:hypothetical protein